MKKTLATNLTAGICLVLLAWLDCWIIQLPRPTYKSFQGMEQVRASIPYFDCLLEDHPSDWKVYLSRGNAYEKLYCYQLALDDYNHALALCPTNLDLVHHRANDLFLIDDLKNSLADYNRIIKESKDNANDFICRSRVYYRLHDYAQAQADANYAIKNAPNATDAHLACAYADAGLGDFTGAKIQCNLAEKLTSVQTTSVEQCLAEITIGQENWKETIAHCDWVLKKNPYHSRILWLRGLAYYKMGNFNQAVSDATASICRDPMVAAPYIVRAQAQYKLEKCEEADLDVGEALKLSSTLHKKEQVYSLNTKGIMHNDFTKFPDTNLAINSPAFPGAVSQ